MKKYIQELYPTKITNRTIRKTRFGEILKGLELGAAYAFDKDSYSIFYPLAKEIGLDVKEANFTEQEKKGNRFFTVQIDFKKMRNKNI
jgi:hypothetical protein